jgi:hypothetical protein
MYHDGRYRDLQSPRSKPVIKLAVDFVKEFGFVLPKTANRNQTLYQSLTTTNVKSACRAHQPSKPSKPTVPVFVTGSLIGPWPGELFAGALEAGRVGLLGSKRVADVIAGRAPTERGGKARIIPAHELVTPAPAE